MSQRPACPLVPGTARRGSRSPRALPTLLLLTVLAFAALSGGLLSAGRAAAEGAADEAAAPPIPVRDLLPPAVSARAVAVLDAESGAILYDKNARRPLPPASLTKIMTALLVLERLPLDRMVTVSLDRRALDPDGSSMGLDVGERLSVEDLLYGLMHLSGNDAAQVLARQVAGDPPAFVRLMNERALQLGLTHTRFLNADGLDAPGHVSSAHDLAQISREAMSNERFRLIVAAPSWTVRSQWTYTIRNRNALLGRYPGAEGIKIGWTEAAGATMAASATREGRRVIVVLLDTQDRVADSAALFEWVFTTFRWPGGPLLSDPASLPD